MPLFSGHSLAKISIKKRDFFHSCLRFIHIEEICLSPESVREDVFTNGPRTNVWSFVWPLSYLLWICVGDYMSVCCLHAGCDVTLNSDSGVVQSPAYGIEDSDYPNIVTCTWTIVSQSAILLTYDDPFALINGDTLKVSELALSISFFLIRIRHFLIFIYLTACSII